MKGVIYSMSIEQIIEELIYLKDKLKDDGYHWRDYDCINYACNELEKLNK